MNGEGHFWTAWFLATTDLKVFELRLFSKSIKKDNKGLEQAFLADLDTEFLSVTKRS